MVDIQTYIMHYAHRSNDGTIRPYNDLLMNCIRSIKNADIIGSLFNKNKIKVNNQINVIFDCDQYFFDDLVKKIDKINSDGKINSGKINLIRDYKNKGASGARNIAIENTIKSQNNGQNKDGIFVILDNDMKVPGGWITNLASELIHAESYFNVGCAISYDQMPYLEEEVIKALKFNKAEEPQQTVDYDNSMLYRNVMRLGEFIEYCKKYNIPFDNSGNVYCRKPFNSGDIKLGGTGVTYSGWRLSNFISSTKFVKKAEEMKAGYSSEELWGFGDEDMEWAVRVFKTPCILLESHTVFIQHMMSFTSSKVYCDRVDNFPIIKKLLGDNVFQGIRSGSIWLKLRQEQINRYGYKVN